MRPTTVNGVQLTAETIYATRRWFANKAIGCALSAQLGEHHVNDLGRYVAWREEAAVSSLDGAGDHTLAFIQRAYFIQTGECVPILS